MAFVGVVLVPALGLAIVDGLLMRDAILESHESKTKVDADTIVNSTLAGKLEVARNYTKFVAASAAQQSTMASQQAAAFQETTTTAAEIAQTSKQSTQQADSVIDLAQRSEDLSRDGKTSVEEATAGMEQLGDQVGAIAQRITELSERAMQIGEVAERLGASGCLWVEPSVLPNSSGARSS